MKASDQDEKRLILLQALSPERVCFLQTTTKAASLHKLIDVLSTSERVRDRDMLTDAVFKREAIMSTGIGLGLAVPHVRIASVSELVMAIGISHAGITDYAALDDKPVHVVFLIAAPEGQHVEYLKLLSAISSRAKSLGGRLLDCADAGELYALLTDTKEAIGASPSVGA